MSVMSNYCQNSSVNHTMADNLRKVPSKGILKTSSSFDKQEAPAAQQSGRRKSQNKTTWDEMNIIATLHPPDKDYGHMKIDEPKTPYNYAESDQADSLDPSKLEERIRMGVGKLPKVMQEEEDDEEDEDDADLTPEERARRREFENRRKKHYNEFQAVKLARELLDNDDEDDDKQEQPSSSTSQGQDYAHGQGHTHGSKDKGSSRCCNMYK